MALLDHDELAKVQLAAVFKAIESVEKFFEWMLLVR